LTNKVRNFYSLLLYIFYSGVLVIRVKRVYDPPSKNDDGYRILVDRLWPRGLSKTEAEIDTWLNDIAPSNDLRRWFDHSPKKWDEFRSRYFQELAKKERILNEIILAKDSSSAGIITLLYGAKELRYNNAVALKEYLEEKLGR
jgi:uncharacterized protein YeaO (DUF488 family)